MDARKVALASVITALYAVSVIVFGSTSFAIVQVRFAYALIPLSIVFGMPVVFGVTLGNVIANAYGGIGLVDIVGGSVANFIAAYVGWKIGSKGFHGSIIIATVAQNLIVSGIVGSYLAVLFEVPLEFGFLGILFGSIVSINIIGYVLVLAIMKSGVLS